MNAYDIVDKLINVNLLDSISEDDLESYGAEGVVVLAILKAHYNAKYSEPEDKYGCGYWRFDNPNYIEYPQLRLYNCPNDNWGVSFDYFCVDTPEIAAAEIIRLDSEFDFSARGEEGETNLYFERENPKYKDRYEKEFQRVLKAIGDEPHVYLGKSFLWKLVLRKGKRRPSN